MTNYHQHCISVMRAKRLKLNFFAHEELCGDKDNELLRNPHYAYTHR